MLKNKRNLDNAKFCGSKSDSANSCHEITHYTIYEKIEIRNQLCDPIDTLCKHKADKKLRNQIEFFEVERTLFQKQNL